MKRKSKTKENKNTPNKWNQDQTTKNKGKKIKTKENDYNTKHENNIPNKWNQDQTTKNKGKKAIQKKTTTTQSMAMLKLNKTKHVDKKKEKIENIPFASPIHQCVAQLR